MGEGGGRILGGRLHVNFDRCGSILHHVYPLPAFHGGYSLLLSLRLLPKGLRPFGIPRHTRLGL